MKTELEISARGALKTKNLGELRYNLTIAPREGIILGETIPYQFQDYVELENDLKDFERFLHEKYCTHLPVELKELKYSVWRKAMESIKKKIM